MNRNFFRNTSWTLAYEVFMAILAFVSVFFIWLDEERWTYLHFVIWLFFFLDVTIRLIISPAKWEYVKKNPLDIIAALPLDALFQTARIARLYRVLRIISLSKNHYKQLFAILRTNGLDRVLTVSVLLIFISTIIVRYVEPNIDSFMDGLWWSIVTTTTVGYGDISPSTAPGRLIAVFLMLIGIGIIGMLTGSITTFFVKEKQTKHPTVEFVQNQLNRFDSLTYSEVNQLALLLNELKKEKMRERSALTKEINHE
ncbi:two pore domain potassium channel family protein [Sediminibacillus dalangtanensis]|uniref:Two pore domain potassium channel family protein n=1 Tax=Sediminibacillus dalangtanensis TaxID=2729421 RepID=A0ABX7VQK2_9BACI|nr:potassium channel family protein [Sediminibacillus dalangtanensis]QTM98783.1 two pore domain potassium channel family protein [Sediminibacillus dalangtanensis]